MSAQSAPLHHAAGEKTGLTQFAIGGSLGLAGVVIIEALFTFGLRPLTPMAWPGLGALAGAALGGPAGFLGGSLVLAAYYFVNLLNSHRFPEFYGHPYSTVSWLLGLAIIGIVILAVRPRLLRAAAAEAELQVRRGYEQALRVITDNLPALVSYVDKEECYRFHNRTYETWLHLDGERINGRTVREVWGEERYAMIAPNVARALRGERVSDEYAIVVEGVERRIMATYVPDLDIAGRVRGFFVMGIDITPLFDAQNELRAQRGRLEAALDGSGAALWDTDLRTGRVYLSEAWADIVGAPRGETVTTTQELLALLHPDDVEPLKRISFEAMKGLRPSYAMEHRVRTRAGDWRWIISRGRVTERDPVTARALRMIGTNFDITERKRMEEALQSVAQTDALTGLANRLLFRDRLDQALARARRHGTRLALVYLDIDRFKEVNDTLGHPAGDALLKEFAARLRGAVRASDTVARLGGDEFVVLLEDVKAEDCAGRVAEKLMTECRRPFMLEAGEIVASTSAGLACGGGSIDAEVLLRRADNALYEAKRAGRDQYRVAPG